MLLLTTSLALSFTGILAARNLFDITNGAGLGVIGYTMRVEVGACIVYFWGMSIGRIWWLGGGEMIMWIIGEVSVVIVWVYGGLPTLQKFGQLMGFQKIWIFKDANNGRG